MSPWRAQPCVGAARVGADEFGRNGGCAYLLSLAEEERRHGPGPGMRKRSWFELQKFESAILCNINFCQK